MTRYSGAWQILRFNWPWYAAAVATTVAGVFLLQTDALRWPWSTLGVIGLCGANYWLVASLAVSHYVYDRSAVSRGEWLHVVDPESIRRTAIFHAGHDEASATLARALPAAAVAKFDFYDRERNGTPSLERARSLAGHDAVAMAADQIPLSDGELDLGLVVFAAHEIRRHSERAAFFRELGRVLALHGKIIVVEHLRDGWNLVAYGPGAFHFLSRTTWRRSFADGGLKLVREATCTPFVRVFELESAP